MGAPLPKIEAAGDGTTEALLDSLKSIGPGERRKHASVFNYWLSIRGNRAFPPIRDLDPLEISDAGPWSVLLEMIGGGEDAVVKHFGQAIRDGNEVERIAEAAAPSLLSCIHSKLPIVAACRQAYAFEDRYETADGTARCWVTLMPFSANGTWIDFVYGYVSLANGDSAEAATDEAIEDTEAPAEAVVDEVEAEPEAAAENELETAEDEAEPFKVPLAPLDADEEPEAVVAEPEPEAEPEADPQPEEVVDLAESDVEPEPEAVAEFDAEPQLDEPVAEYEAEPDPVAEYEPEPAPEPEAEVEGEAETESGRGHVQKPGFTKFLEGLYGKVTQSSQNETEQDFVEPEPETVAELLAEADAVAAEEEAEAQAEAEAVALEADELQPDQEFEAPVSPTPASNVEGKLHAKLTDVRALAEEAREAQIRSNMALYEGLSAAYDFALDAEDEPEEYLRLVEAQGLKIQLRSPMKPVVKLAFDGMCDDPTIKQLEAVLAWALKHDLPRGTLSERIQAEGGIGAILNGQA